MATHFSANQYDQAFAAQRLQNWEVPQRFKERPSQLEGFTQPIANNRGHLLAGVPRSKVSPWGEFMGTWDMVRPPLRTKTMKTKAALQQSKPESDAVRTPSPQAAKTPSPVPQGVRMASPVAMTARTPSPKARTPSPAVRTPTPAARTPSPVKTPEKAATPRQVIRTPSPQKAASPTQQVNMA